MDFNKGDKIKSEVYWVKDFWDEIHYPELKVVKIHPQHWGDNNGMLLEVTDGLENCLIPAWLCSKIKD